MAVVKVVTDSVTAGKVFILIMVAILVSSIHRACLLRFVYEDERGIFPETVFVFDLELPAEFQPLCSDDEVDEFYLMTVPEVIAFVIF